jgi:hypothetical protein
MADPTTPNLGLILPAIGADQDVWGGYTNTNWSTVDTAYGTLVNKAGDMNAAHNVTAGNDVTANHNISAGNNLIAGNNVQTQTMDTTSDVAVGGNLWVTRGLTVQGGMYCVGTATFGGNIIGVNVAVSSNGFKPGGGVWADSSDVRIKTVLGDYDQGLDAVLALQPVRYRLIGNWEPHRGVARDAEFVGLVAQDAEAAMPEMVRKTSAIVGDRFVDDLRILDASSLTYALVNSVKELATRVAALQARLDAV